ncbi:MAG: nucleoside triphosphate pyrophosphohydrolase [Candidatus Nomurabacteria bacterium]|jgi:predicted house-cleaning noncanonical NTP pyrophosphatase (MazG superfamily)|nr:nucleoside triphosphate pyrophosphohydrolase [Candidatus Nomurabacteria bacterium]
MTKFYYNKNGKLVRDKIPALHRAEGHILKMRRLGKDELADAILGKFPEELQELIDEKSAGDAGREKKEIADLLTLIESYIVARGFTKEEIRTVQAEKDAERGAFHDGAWIDWIDLNDNCPDGQRLLKKFHKESGKYIEEVK